MLGLALSYLAAAGWNNGTDLDSDRRRLIINGEQTEPFEHTYQVLISTDKYIHAGGQPTCGGSLYSARHVLTAAHCFDYDGLDPSRYFVYVHRWDLSKAKDHPTCSARFGVVEIRSRL